MVDPTPITPPPATVEAKVTAASLLSLVASILVALLNSVVADSSMLGGLPAWAQFLILAAAPPLLTFLGGYALPSRTSAVSSGYEYGYKQAA